MRKEPAGDFFSKVAANYAKYRTSYPDELIRFVMWYVKERGTAWDCATGSGQTARKLSPYFKKVYATDVSNAQMSYAPALENVEYRNGRAEDSGLPAACCDLVVASQAAHWFDMAEAAEEFRRVAKPGAVVALWGYSPPRFNPQIDAIFDDFYFHTLGEYWNPCRRLVDERYRNLYFPFKEIPALEFVYSVVFDLDFFAGYLRTWSAVGNYIRARGTDPVSELVAQLKPLWKGKMLGHYPLFLRLGYAH